MTGVLDQIRRTIRGRDGRAWAGSVDDLLYDGETVRRRVSVGDNRVVVTSHRLLAFTPERDGENYRQVDLPNVTDVRAGHEGEDNLIAQAARVLLYGVILLAVGFFIDFEAIVPTDAFGGTGEAAGQMGLGGVIGTMQTFLGIIAQLDDVARMIGALLVVFGVFILGVYLHTRERALVIATAGDDEDILVPVGDEDDPDPAVTELEAVLFDGEADGTSGPDGTDDTVDADPLRSDDADLL